MISKERSLVYTASKIVGTNGATRGLAAKSASPLAGRMRKVARSLVLEQ